MARYDNEFVGIPGRFARPTGLDPNYVDGYQGLRMESDGTNAAYGAHRYIHQRDLETEGGFDGIHQRTGARVPLTSSRAEDEGSAVSRAEARFQA